MLKISPSIPRGSKILLMGDSLAQGMSHQFDEITKKEYISKKYFIQGTRTDFWAERIDAIISQEKPDLVIISLGTNDSGLLDPERQRKHVIKIRDSIKNSGSLMLWVLPPSLPSRLTGKEKMNKILFEEISKDDSYPCKNDLERSKDKIHMTPKGYKDWVLGVWEHLKNLGILS